MKKQHLIIAGVVIGIGVVAYIYSKKKTVLAKNQDGSEKKDFKTKDGKSVTIVNKSGDYIIGTSLYDSTGKVIAMISNDATDANGTAKAVFVSENGAFVASPDGSLLSSSDGTSYVSPNGTVYLNQQ